VKHMVRLVVTGLLALALTPVLAQEAPEQPSDTPGEEQTMPMMPGMMGSSGGHGGMMQMMQMMNHCASMMETMHSGAHEEMGMGHDGQTIRGMMPEMMGVRFDPVAAEGLARAFLAGRSSEAVEIQEIDFDSGLYAVSYRQGDDEGTLMVDAATGEVRDESR
jgi:hypothetical protein